MQAEIASSTDQAALNLELRHFQQTLAMFLFTTLDFVDPARKQQSLIVEQPLQTGACARHFIERCYPLLI